MCFATLLKYFVSIIALSLRALRAARQYWICGEQLQAFVELVKHFSETALSDGSLYITCGSSRRVYFYVPFPKILGFAAVFRIKVFIAHPVDRNHLGACAEHSWYHFP